MLVKTQDVTEVEDLRLQFEKMDIDSTGFIEKSELKKVLSDTNHKMSSSEIDRIIDEVDYFGNHKISYTEFLAATMDAKS